MTIDLYSNNTRRIVGRVEVRNSCRRRPRQIGRAVRGSDSVGSRLKQVHERPWLLVDKPPKRIKRFMWRAGGQETTRLAEPVTMTDERSFRPKAAARSQVRHCRPKRSTTIPPRCPVQPATAHPPDPGRANRTPRLGVMGGGSRKPAVGNHLAVRRLADQTPHLFVEGELVGRGCVTHGSVFRRCKRSLARRFV